MDVMTIILIILGLCLFEIISSIDNAVVNADVLATMGKKGRKWFLLWGLILSVFLVRGLLPWLIVYFTDPSLGFIGSLTATFSTNPAIKASIDSSAPVLLAGGGVFLLFLFLHWLFLEAKSFGLVGEKFFLRQGVWFYATVSVILAVLVWFALAIKPTMAFGAVVGSTAFFIIHGFKQNAEKAEEALIHKKHISDISKNLYLLVLDATFSIDGVLGAFAFTLAVPLIVIGNGLGALVVRQLTVHNVDNIKRYIFLKNGAMYSILCLGIIMILDAFGFEIASWVSPAVTFIVIGYFFQKSRISLKEMETLGKKAIKK